MWVHDVEMTSPVVERYDGKTLVKTLLYELARCGGVAGLFWTMKILLVLAVVGTRWPHRGHRGAGDHTALTRLLFGDQLGKGSTEEPREKSRRFAGLAVLLLHVEVIESLPADIVMGQVLSGLLYWGHGGCEARTVLVPGDLVVSGHWEGEVVNIAGHLASIASMASRLVQVTLTKLGDLPPARISINMRHVLYSTVLYCTVLYWPVSGGCMTRETAVPFLLSQLEAPHPPEVGHLRRKSIRMKVAGEATHNFQTRNLFIAVYHMSTCKFLCTLKRC